MRDHVALPARLAHPDPQGPHGALAPPAGPAEPAAPDVQERHDLAHVPVELLAKLRGDAGGAPVPPGRQAQRGSGELPHPDPTRRELVPRLSERSHPAGHGLHATHRELLRDRTVDTRVVPVLPLEINLFPHVVVARHELTEAPVHHAQEQQVPHGGPGQIREHQRQHVVVQAQALVPYPPPAALPSHLFRLHGVA